MIRKSKSQQLVFIFRITERHTVQFAHTAFSFFPVDFKNIVDLPPKFSPHGGKTKWPFQYLQFIWPACIRLTYMFEKTS